MLLVFWVGAVAVLVWALLAAADSRGLARLSSLRAVHVASLERFGAGIGTALAAAVNSPGWKSTAPSLTRIAERVEADGGEIGVMFRQALGAPELAQTSGAELANYRWVDAELRAAFATLLADPGVDGLLIVRRRDGRILFDSHSGPASRIGEVLPEMPRGRIARDSDANATIRQHALSPSGQAALLMSAGDGADAPILLIARLSARRIAEIAESAGDASASPRVSLSDESGRVYLPTVGDRPFPPEALLVQGRQSLAEGPFEGRVGEIYYAAAPVRMGQLVLALTVDAPVARARASVWPTIVGGAALLAVLAALLLLGQRALGRSAVQDAPLGQLRRVVDAIGAGRFDERTGFARSAARGEIREIGCALDRALDGPIAEIARGQAESDALNDSVIEIMRSVGTIATSKDLSIRVPVTEDVTGAISDALNLLTDETARVFRQVRAVSGDVARASLAVKVQADRAGEAAAAEQREVGLAARELEAAAGALAAASTVAERADKGAREAARTNESAARMVGQTLEGVRAARALISATEQQAKRLAERSQEIGQILTIIRSISERTSILALNASLQASASDAGARGFGSVADEVRRLSGSARDSTQQIADLVSAIQSDTGQTIAAMSAAIAQVVEVTRLSERAGAQMVLSRESTDRLAADIAAIAQSAQRQAGASATLQERARRIQRASAQSAAALARQGAEISRLADCARALLDEVGVFKVDS